jgi:hypothetical protein
MAKGCGGKGLGRELGSWERRGGRIDAEEAKGETMHAGHAIDEVKERMGKCEDATRGNLVR